MPALHRRTLLLAGFALGQGAAAGQAPEPTRRKTILEQVVPRVTGKNGYEELVMAADLLQGCPRFLAAEKRLGQDLTLAMRRRVLAEPAVVRAVGLVRQALSKPIRSPRDPETLSVFTLLPELSAFRQLGRLLQMQQYVALADGRTAEAIETGRTGLRMGQVIQTDTMISGLVGVAVGALALAKIGDHLDQFSARDCERLQQVCLEWLRQGDPFLRILEVERQAERSMLQDLRNSSRQQILEMFISASPSNSPTPEDKARANRIADDILRARSSPEAMDLLLSETDRRIDDVYHDVFAEVRRPPWERRWDSLRPAADADGNPASELTDLLLPAFGQVHNAYTRDAARMRLLLVHAAILRFRWEYDRPPRELAELRLGELILDPFTGQPLRYQVSGRRYRLASAGPEAKPDDANAVDGRLPVTFGPPN